MVRVILMTMFLSLTSFAQTSGQALTGDQLFAEGKYKEAAAVFEQTPVAQRTSDSLNRMGVSYHMLNRLKEAEAAYKLALKANSGNAAAHNNLGSLYYTQRKFPEADGEIRQATEADPQNTVVRRNLRSSRYARENSRVARTRADEAAVQRPLLVEERYGDLLAVVVLMPAKDVESAVNFEKRGDAFLVRKMYDDAIIEYKKSISFDKYNASVVNRLGLTYHQNQKFAEAEKEYREALKLNAYYVEALNNLGTIFYSRSRFSDALDYYRKAMKISPNSATVLTNIGSCLFKLNRPDEGAAMYDRALTVDPQLFARQASGGVGNLIQMTEQRDSTTSFYLARVFAGKGDKDRAISYLYSAYDTGFKDVEKLKAEPAFASLRDDERFIRLIETMSSPGGPRT